MRFWRKKHPDSLKAAPAKARLTLETLEERVTLSASAITHEAWRTLKLDATPLVPAFADSPSASRQLDSAQAAASSFGPLIGMGAAHSTFDYTGTGYSVAVLDTGIDYNHEDLGGGWGKRVVAGYDFINNDADPLDDNGHGTHIAGIIGSSSTTYPGIAPNVNLLAVKVLDKNNNGAWTTIEKGLQWVIANQAKYNIAAVNLSLGSGNYTVNPYSLLEDEFASLKSLGVFTSVAAGNRFYTYGSQPGVGYPATSPYVVSVAAVWTADVGRVKFASGATDFTTAPDRIVSFSQRSSALSLLAPGAWIVSTLPGGGYGTMAGTSMATAVVSGAATLLQQAYDANGAGHLANQDALLKLMQTTGVTVNDGDDENDNVTNTGLSFKRLNLHAALGAVPQAPRIAPIANQTFPSTGSLTVTLQATDANRDVVAFSARVVDDRAMAYYLDQKHGFRSLGNTYTNVRGAGEKWFVDAKGIWFGIFPSGELRRWAGSLTDTLKPVNLYGTFGSAYHKDPSLLWNAPPAFYPPVSLSVLGSQLAIKSLGAWSAPFVVEVTASDGTFIVKERFTVTRAPNSAPVISSIPDQVLARGALTLSLPVMATDVDGDTLAFSARVLTPSAQAWQLDQQLGLSQYNGSYYTNIWGQGEKWLLGTGGGWYCLMNDGGLYRWAGTFARTAVAPNLVAQLDAMFYVEPRLLWDAKAPVVPALTVTMSGRQLTVQRPASLVGVFFLEVTANDGKATTKRTFMLTLN